MKLTHYLKKIHEANTLFKKEKYESAALIIDDLLEIYPFQPDLLLKKFIIDHFIDEGTIDDLETTINKVKKILPKYSNVHLELGDFFYSMKANSQKSLAIFQHAEYLAKGDLIQAYKGVIRSLIDLGRFDEAKNKYRELQQMFPDDEDCSIWELQLEIPELHD